MLTDTRANRRRRALEASGILRYQWAGKPDGGDDVDETAAGLWRAREEASWEAAQRRLETTLAALETEHGRQWRRQLGRQKRRKARLQAAIEGEPGRIPVLPRRLWWWLRLRPAGGGGILTLGTALKGGADTAAEWTEALERKHVLQAASLGERHERQLARAAHAVARAYGADMDRQVARCRRDATALLAAEPDREAGVKARPMAASAELAPPGGAG